MMEVDITEVDLRENPQIIYFANRNALGLGMNMIASGIRLFARTYKYTNLKKLKELSDSVKSKDFNAQEAGLFAFENVLDSLKIATCIELFLKAILICDNYVIHQIDKKVLPELHKIQKQRPLKVDEVFKFDSWEVNNNLKGIVHNEFKKQRRGVKNSTLFISLMLKAEYLKPFDIAGKLADFMPYILERNYIHFYFDNRIHFSENSYSEFCKLIDFINKEVVRFHNLLVDEIGKGVIYKCPELPIT